MSDHAAVQPLPDLTKGPTSSYDPPRQRKIDVRSHGEMNEKEASELRAQGIELAAAHCRKLGKHMDTEKERVLLAISQQLLSLAKKTRSHE